MSFSLLYGRLGTRIGVSLVALVGLSAALMVDVPGFAEITSPEPSANVSGIVSISGTANHPAFLSYQLAYEPDPNPSNTWTAIAGFVRSPVLDGRLGLWDTTRIRDGNYRLRLLVRVAGAEPLQAIVGQIQVRNYTPTEAPPTVQPTASLATTVPVDSQGATAPPPAGAANRFASALAIGVLGALSSLLALSTYALLAPRVRAYVARMRTRRLYRDQDLSRTRGSGRG